MTGRLRENGEPTRAERRQEWALWKDCISEAFDLCVDRSVKVVSRELTHAERGLVVVYPS